MKKLVIRSLLLLALCEAYSFAKVNTESLNFIEQKQDVYFGCFGFPLEIVRTYNSQSTIVSGFGKGWTYNYNIRLQDRDGYIRVFEADGFLASYIPEKYSDLNREENINEIIKKIIAEEKKAHKLRTKEGYKELSELLKRDYSKYEGMRNQYLIKTGETTKGKYISTARGITDLFKTDNGYVRTNVLGVKEFFDNDGRLIRTKDAYDNALSLEYFTNKIVVTDACKRKLTINVDEDRKIKSLVDHKGRKLEYQYYKDGQLGKVIDFDNSSLTYKYDKKQRLESIVYPKKDKKAQAESVKIIYGEYNRVKEIQGPGDKVTTYERTVYPKNKRNFKMLIRDNKGTWEEYNYIKDEHKTIKTYKDGTKEITLLDPASDRPTKYTNRKNETVYHEYDARGNRIRTTNSNGAITEFTYPNNRLTDIIKSNGQKITYTFNTKGDVVGAKLIDITTPQKKILKELVIVLNERGKKRLYDDKQGNNISMDYDSYGNMTKLEKLGVGKLVYSYDSLGNELSRKFVQDTNYKEKLTMEELRSIISSSIAELMTLLEY